MYSGNVSVNLAETDSIRRTIALPSDLAQKVDSVAASRHVSVDRAIIDLLNEAIIGYEQRRAAYIELAERFQKSTDPVETEQLREELARMTFGV